MVLGIPPGRWPVRKALVAAAMAIVLALYCIGCTSVIRSPVQVDDPTTVYLLRDDRHRGLILPGSGGELIEYAYGEWAWYAMAEEGCSGGCRAMLWPTQGTLGRRATGSFDEEELTRRFHWMTIVPIVVDRDRVSALRSALEAAHASRRDDMVYSSRYGFDFVPHEESYWLLHNCNDKVADWCEELGCVATWVPVCVDLQCEAAPESR